METLLIDLFWKIEDPEFEGSSVGRVKTVELIARN